eukprot:CAMPEP_0168330234 /NCGR_PEP_ID=MMETSP0213-20121227/7596_1 /TAXON_ID=151035 /ORGANISM="Euplotes harpa, Strain FSP1.4" /LENGTH=214 /DNA_ID=CAMNT_0008333739 /DNA_START=1093 /DNA_END=1737 /DNA_ORIENTATION=+
MAVLFAGHETTSKTFLSALLHLKRNPHVEKKLRQEFNEVLLENGKFTVHDLDSIICNDKLEELEYLTYFIKEVLRHDPPAARSLGYIAKSKFKLGDVFVPKGQVLVLNVLCSHYDEKQWREPMKFIPERFDPSSEYFRTPEGKPRDPLAWAPFTFGPRTCMGRALALMELKILMIYFMLSIDYEIDDETLKNDNVSYAILSPFALDIKITKVFA